MRRPAMAVLGVVLFAASVVGFCISLTALLEVGTCASGNTPYVISTPCPDGTGANVLVLTLSIFGLLGSAVLFALRGAPGGGGPLPFLAGWSIFFTATGTVALVHTLTSETIPADAQMGGQIVGVIFLLMGLPVLFFTAWKAVGGRRNDGGRRAPAFGSRSGMDAASLRSLSALASRLGEARSGGASASADTIDQLERLQRLRDAGTLSEAEFAEQKSRILGR